jgi:hypothetical protein
MIPITHLEPLERCETQRRAKEEGFTSVERSKEY